MSGFAGGALAGGAAAAFLHDNPSHLLPGAGLAAGGPDCRTRFRIVRVADRSRMRDRSQVPETDRELVGPNDLTSDLILGDQDNQINGQQAPGKENLLKVYRIEFVIAINRTNGAWLAAKSSPTL